MSVLNLSFSAYIIIIVAHICVTFVISLQTLIELSELAQVVICLVPFLAGAPAIQTADFHGSLQSLQINVEDGNLN